MPSQLDLVKTLAGYQPLKATEGCFVYRLAYSKTEGPNLCLRLYSYPVDVKQLLDKDESFIVDRVLEEIYKIAKRATPLPMDVGDLNEEIFFTLLTLQSNLIAQNTRRGPANRYLISQGLYNLITGTEPNGEYTERLLERSLGEFMCLVDTHNPLIQAVALYKGNESDTGIIMCHDELMAHYAVLSIPETSPDYIRTFIFE